MQKAARKAVPIGGLRDSVPELQNSALTNCSGKKAAACVRGRLTSGEKWNAG